MNNLTDSDKSECSGPCLPHCFRSSKFRWFGFGLIVGLGLLYVFLYKKI